MSSRRSWSKRFDVKVVPRRYLHLYRCFGWTPTTPTAIPQYDWEREGPNSAAHYTSADISGNLQEYDDLGLQRKEFIAVKRNTKFYQYKRQYPKLFKDEKRFNKLMARYTVGPSTKITGLRQVFYIMRRIIFFLWALICFGLFAGSFYGPLQYQFVSIMNKESILPGVAFGVFTLLFFILAHQEIALGLVKDLNRVAGEEEDFIHIHKREKYVITFKLYIFALAGLASLYLMLCCFLPDALPRFWEKWIELSMIQMLLYTLRIYGLCAGFAHMFIALLNFNPYAWIKALCLQARPITKKILFNDISMMSPQQRQRYNQGRIISSAVSDALDKREKGIKEDFYIGY